MADSEGAIASYIVGAFVAGAGLMYGVGKDAGRRENQASEAELKAKLESQTGSIQTLENTIRELRTQANKKDDAASTPPTEEQSNRLLQALSRDDKETWLSFPALKPEKHDDFIASTELRIISVANLKGGVGKTTVTANLAAYFDRILEKEVLVIDSDYQGSLSSILKTVARNQDSTATTADWLSHLGDAESALRTANRINDALERTRFVSAFYELSNIETRLMVQWLLDCIGGSGKPDLRYAFSRILHSAAAKSRYKVVLIDCPPRLSTATINAIAASTHLLIPTVPDESSLEAVANFIAMASKVKAELNPNLSLLGVVPMMTQNKNLNEDEKERLDGLRLRAVQFGGEPHIFSSNIPHNKPIADLAGTSIALVRGESATKKLFAVLGKEVSERLGWAT